MNNLYDLAKERAYLSVYLYIAELFFHRALKPKVTPEYKII